MDFFGPDVSAINRKRQGAVDAATGQFVDSMTPYLNSGNNANIKNQQGMTAANFSGFDVLGDVNQYLDPSLNHQIETSTGQLQNAFGTRGSLFSGAAGNAISENARQQAEQGWGDAFARATGARQQQFANQMGIDQFNNAANQTNFQNQFGVNQADFANRNDVYGTLLGNQVGAANAAAQASMAEKSPWDYVVDTAKIAGGIGAAIGGLG
jgi:hypothetical protein